MLINKDTFSTKYVIAKLTSKTDQGYYSKTPLLRSAGDQQIHFVINVLHCIVYNEVPKN